MRNGSTGEENVEQVSKKYDLLAISTHGLHIAAVGERLLALLISSGNKWAPFERRRSEPLSTHPTSIRDSRCTGIQDEERMASLSILCWCIVFARRNNHYVCFRANSRSTLNACFDRQFRSASAYFNSDSGIRACFISMLPPLVKANRGSNMQQRKMHV